MGALRQAGQGLRHRSGPGVTEPAVAHCRIGLDGVPVVYRVKAEPGKKYVICLGLDAAYLGLLAGEPQAGRRPRL